MEMLAIDDADVGSRSEPRTSLFVMASMTARSVSGPVKVRNLSTFGGLIEGPQLPALGEALQLRRGGLSASGRVVWRSGTKAGLRLDDPIAVTDWLPSGLSGQAIVDDTFQRMKAAGGQAPRQTSPSHMLPYDQGQLNQSASALDALADALAEDPDIVARFASELQVLDTAAQIMRKIAEACPHPGRE
jgi:hypothetical protein